MADLSLFEWKSKLQEATDVIILDVRTKEEWDEGIIPKAEVLDIYSGQNFIDTLETFDKDKSYFVYCRSGVRSAQACTIMNQLGFKKTYNLLGGILAWDGEIVR